MVSPMQAALILYVAGAAVLAVATVKEMQKLEAADPMDLCDRCREFRREWLTAVSMVRAVWVGLLALAVVVVALTWPVTLPLAVYDRVARGRHRCRGDA